MRTLTQTLAVLGSGNCDSDGTDRANDEAASPIRRDQGRHGTRADSYTARSDRNGYYGCTLHLHH